jgi:hypothetical protein
MHIEKIEYGTEKEGFWSQVAFILIIILTLVAAGLTGQMIWRIVFTDPSGASTRLFVEGTGKTLAYLLFDMAAIIYLYVKGILQDEHVTALE